MHTYKNVSKNPVELQIRTIQPQDLAGVAELAFGFPEQGDAYLGLMILAPEARSQGFGVHPMEL